MRWYDSRAYSGRQLPRAKTRVVSRTHSNSDPVYSDFLMHYGIAGQKWGVRRYENEDGTLTEEGKVRYNKKSESETWKKSDLRNLSDDELNKRNSRLQRERQYKDLTTTDREREISQFKKDVIKKALVLPLLAVIGIAGRKYIGQAATKVASVIGKYGKTALKSLKRMGEKKRLLSRSADTYGKNPSGIRAAQIEIDNMARGRQAMRRNYELRNARNYNYWPRGRGAFPKQAEWPKF